MISYGKKFLMLVMIITCSCSSNGENRNSTERIPISNDTISCSVLGQRLNDVFLIKNDINLKNKKCFLPPNVSLQFKGGIVRNGTLIGRMTKLFGKGIYFDKVRIEGSWDVPVIKSSFFKDLNYNNSIKDVIALSHPNINNKIIIGKSVFQVTANKYADICVPICSNTELILNGIIKMSPNKYGKYFIIQAEGDNIIIRGKGQIVGDRNAHTGNDGEWGMGINLKGAHHVKIRINRVIDGQQPSLIITTASRLKGIMVPCTGNKHPRSSYPRRGLPGHTTLLSRITGKPGDVIRSVSCIVRIILIVRYFDF